MYEVLKDFQPLIAALVALGAAIIAFASAQLVAHSQSETARRTTDRQIAHAIAKEDEADLKRLLVMLSSRFRALAISIRRRLVLLEMFRDQAPQSNDGKTYAVRGMPLVWSALIAMKMLREESRFYEVKWEDVSMVRPNDIAALNHVIIVIDTCDEAVSIAMRTADRHEFVHKEQIEGAINAMNGALESIKLSETQIANSLKELIPEASALRRMVRATTEPARGPAPNPEGPAIPVL